ncbi:TetR/AcrR family transcriptional regulator [Nocardioides sp.]|uniref:TetR/AcrR family transcriptional regulator n=1 Tax=Nocardioides sp. TaxID=35761 RepID=UPI002B272664|nr:TetR/AcrR family transcriptional regulator [Nocardioides sp.]
MSTGWDRRRELTRADILHAAWTLCRDRGLAGLSMRDLAVEVGLRAPSLYSYFASKSEIYDAMFADGQRALLEMTAARAEPPSGREGLRSTTAAFVSFCVAEPVRYQLLFQRPIPGFVPSETSYGLALEFYRTYTADMERIGVTDQRLLDLWSALVTGLTDQQVSNDPGGDRWISLLDEAVDMFCGHARLLGEPVTTT